MIQLFFRMLKKTKVFTLIILMFCLSFSALAGSSAAIRDSLKALLEDESLKDSRKAYLYIQLAMAGMNSRESLSYAEQAIVHARNCKNETLLAYALGELGFQHRRLGNIDASLKAYLEALQINEDQQNFENIAVINAKIGINYDLLGEHHQYINYMRQAITYWPKNGVLLDLERYMLNLGEGFRKLKQYDSAKFYCHKALEMNAITKDVSTRGYEFGNLGMIYQHMGAYDSAKHLLTKSLDALMPTNDFYPISVYQVCLAEIYINEGDKARGEEILLQSLAMVSDHGMKEQIRDFSKKLYHFYLEEKKFDKSLHFHEQYVLYKDSLQNIENVKEIERTKTAYEIDKRETEIHSLNSSNEIKRNIIIAVLSGVILLLGLLYLLFLTYRRERHTNRALEKSKRIIQGSLEEKEVLIREIHHRVKNNLQIISSLLELQSFSEKDKNVQDAIQKSQKRLQSIALIHQELYQQENLAKVNLKEYLEKLMSTLLAFFTDVSVSVKVAMDIPKIEYDIEKAAPIGLILNELITNSYKYAFSGRKEGNIRVAVEKHEGNGLSLTFSDDGAGLPEDFDLKKAKSLGLRLIHILTKQIKGEVSFFNNGGANFVITIPNTINSIT